MTHLLLHPGVRIDDMRAAAFKRPLLSLPEGEELLLPVCSAKERGTAQVISKGERVRRFEPLARDGDGLPLCYAPTAGTVDGCVAKDIPGRGKMICVRLIPGSGEHAARTLSRPSRTEATPQKILRAAGLLRLDDETDGEPLQEKLERYRSEEIDTLVCDALCDDPFMADGLCALTEMTEEVCDGLQLAAKACGCGRMLIAVFRAQAAGFGAVQRLKSSLDGCELLNINGKYPVWPALKRLRRFADQKLGRIGVQACLQLSRAVRLGRPAERCVITVSGDGVQKPQNLSVLIGTPVSEVLAHTALSEEDDIAAVVVHGAFAGHAVADLETPVLADTRCVLAMTRRAGRRKSGCIGCGRCNEVCGENVFVSEAGRAVRRGRPEEALLYGAERCIGCRACDVVCPGGTNPSELVLGTLPPKAKRLVFSEKKACERNGGNHD
ncbi:MAG: 4Fe-4S dicluster domain-containing protein [Acutalibacteraceae bacterium]